MSNTTSIPATILLNLYNGDCTYLMDAGQALVAITDMLEDPALEDKLERSYVVGLNCAIRFIGHQLGIRAESMQKQIHTVQNALEEQEVRHEN